MFITYLFESSGTPLPYLTSGKYIDNSYILIFLVKVHEYNILYTIYYIVNESNMYCLFHMLNTYDINDIVWLALSIIY